MKALDVAALPSTTRASDFLALAKVRVNTLVVATTLLGYYLAAGSLLDFLLLFNTLAGTALVAAGAAAFNQIYERDADALMVRTRHRPVAGGRLHPTEATHFAVLLSVGGIMVLAIGASVLAALVAATTLVTYTLVYTPLKPRTPLSTIVGAVPGALPPLIGWAAADNQLPPAAWTLFAIVFLWQIPHFLAIAWAYRDDYARAGFRVLPVIEVDGRRTARHVMVATMALVPASLLPTLVGMSGWTYGVGALLLGGFFLAAGWRFARIRTTATARRLFLTSIVYLPLVWLLMAVDKQ